MSVVGDTIGPFDVPTNEEPWVFKVKRHEKTKLLGSALVACGGLPAGASPLPDPAASTANQKAKASTDDVPFNLHTRNPILYEELQHSYNIEGWLDTTANDGLLAMASIKTNKPYVGVCFTQDHADRLRDFILESIFTAFQTEGDALHQPGLGDLLGASTPSKKGSAGKPTSPKDTPGPGKPRKDDPNPTPQKESKKDEGQLTKKALLKQLASLDEDEPDDSDDEKSEVDA